MIIFFFLNALSLSGEKPIALPTEQQAVIHITESFAQADTQPINIGCATDLDAVQIEKLDWSPHCSRGTLTNISNVLVYNGALNLELALGGQVSTWMILQQERERFSDPHVVTAVYQQLKPLVIPIIKTGTPENLDSVHTYLNTVLIPDFTLEVPKSVREFYRFEAEDYVVLMKNWNPVTFKNYQQANSVFGDYAIRAGFHDPLALQWRLRREKEGGEALVSAWRDIFVDLAQSI